jgi:hypothetical protein
MLHDDRDVPGAARTRRASTDGRLRTSFEGSSAEDGDVSTSMSTSNAIRGFENCRSGGDRPLETDDSAESPSSAAAAAVLSAGSPKNGSVRDAS